MTILFHLRHPGTLRNFSSTVRLLAERGHDVHLAFAMHDRMGDGRLLWEATRDQPRVTVAEAGDKAGWRVWIRLARYGRACTDYLRYLTPDYANAPALKARAEAKTPPGFSAFCRWPLINSAGGRSLLRRLLALVERAIPSDRWVEAQISAQRPDVVIVSPLVDFASDQVDVVKSAKALGIHTALAVHSWDNLTNKGLIRLLPDRVIVWNDFQKKEAVTMHGVPESAVVVTGAATYDQWFDRLPSRTRNLFCQEVGLDADRPFFVYLCSSPFIAPNESEFIERWIAHVRASKDPDLARAGILVRPHPENRQPWHRFDLAALENVAIWPRGGANPVDAESKNDYFDSLFHCVAAVGVNSSALIEAGVVGRAVYTIRAPEFAGTQDGTRHFHYLLHVGGGLLRVAADLDEHCQQLIGALTDPAANQREARAFVEDFVRPNGLDQPATGLFADAVEALGREPRPRPERTPAWLLPLRVGLYPLAWSLKLVREFARVSRKRERALKSSTTTGLLQRAVLAPVEFVLRWRPIKDFAKDVLLPRVLPYGVDANRPTEEMGAVPRLVKKLSQNDQPIIIGPWMGDVQLELLYWIPFLHWVRAQHEFVSTQIVAVSRGGAGAWYDAVSTSYVDLLDFFTPDQLAAKSLGLRALPPEKRRSMGEFDREILKLVQLSVGTRKGTHLHPMQMYRLLAPFWLSQLPVSLVESFTKFERLRDVGRCPPEWALPDSYAAVKFSFGEAFPDTESNRKFVRAVLHQLTESTDVVLLNTGLSFETVPEPDWLETGRRLHRIDRLVTPGNNLDVQTRVIANADFFAGSHGGLSCLPPYYGVSSLAIHSAPEALSGRHLEVARRAFGTGALGSLMIMHVADWTLVRDIMGRTDSPMAPRVAGVSGA